MKSFNYSPIGVFRCSNTYKYEAPRQPYEDETSELAHIRLFSGQTNFIQALKGLDGFKRLWLIFEFDQSTGWKPMTQTPRETDKQGVFATRSPYRPNPIGLSCVKLSHIDGLKIYVTEFDLLDKTPILDIKPYIPAADSFNVQNTSWLEKEKLKEVDFTKGVLEELDWIEQNGEGKIKSFIKDQLKRDPLNSSKKRLKKLSNTNYCLSFRTWRVYFNYSDKENRSLIYKVLSGYSKLDFDSDCDKYQNKLKHLEYLNMFSSI